MERKLLIASSNRGKIREIKEYLTDLDLELIGLPELAPLPEVIEDGISFRENALKKARSRAAETGITTLADDSGLEVDYLKGRPGVYSARYAGLLANDQANNDKLLSELAGVPLLKRQARFKSVLVLVEPGGGAELIAEGCCEGIIIDSPRGNNGFGYDPLFYLPEYKKTMAELPLQLKNKISHRAKALVKMKELLIDRKGEY